MSKLESSTEWCMTILEGSVCAIPDSWCRGGYSGDAYFTSEQLFGPAEHFSVWAGSSGNELLACPGWLARRGTMSATRLRWTAAAKPRPRAAEGRPRPSRVNWSRARRRGVSL